MGKKAKAPTRQERLAQALRDNLKRRKAQRRGRKSGADGNGARDSHAPAKEKDRQ